MASRRTEEGGDEERRAADARDAALAAVLARHDLEGKRFHNEAVVREVADEVARRVLDAVRTAE